MRSGLPSISALIFALLFTSFNGFAFDEKVLFRNYATQYLYCDSIYNTLGWANSPTQTEALKEIDNLEEWANAKGDVELALSIRLLRDRYLTRVPTMGKRGEKDLLAVIKKLKNLNLPYLLAESMELLSIYYWDHRRYSESFEYGIRANTIYSKFNYAEFPQITDYLFSYGSIYYHFGDYYTAKGLFLQATNSSPIELAPGGISKFNSLAMSYLKLDKLDSAAYYFKIAYEVAIVHKSDIWPEIINGNLASIYFLQKKYDKAIPLLEADIKRSIEADRLNAANSLSLLARIYLEKKENAKALQYVVQAYNIITKNGDVKEYKVRNRIFPVLAKAYYANGNLALAHSFLDSAIDAKDSFAKYTNMLILTGVQHKMEANRHIQLAEDYERERKKQKLIFNGFLIGIALFLLTSGLFINSQRLKYIHRRKQLETEKKLAEAELNNAARQLEDFTNSLSEKNDLIEKFASEMHRLKGQNKIGETEDNEAFLELQRSTILSEGQWTNFQVMFEKAHKGFVERLDKKVKGLSPVEKRFMLLSKLKISKKEMAMMLGISVDAVRLNRSRLRAKLNLPDEDFSLEDFADNI